MTAVAAPASKGVQANAPVTFRAIIEQRRAEGQRLGLDDAIAVIVPVCIDLKERHAKGESFYVHPSSIAKTPDGLYRLHPQLATNPKDPRDRAALAPEVLRANGPGGARASVFAIGAMLYEAVCGSPVGPGMRRPRDVDPTLPEALEHLLAKALVADPSHRPDDLGALASAMHHLAPMKSIPPPDADLSKLDRSDNFEVDIRLSIMPPERDSSIPMPPPSADNLQIVMPQGPTSAAAAASAAAQAAATQAMAIAAAKDPTRHLASLKARLEADPRPRYVVNKARMDHGPFNAVELLQQIASHKFVGTDTLRDELTGGSKVIDEWEEFAPFAQHARLHRDIAHEKKEVAKIEKAEKTSGRAKLIVGIIGAVALLAVGVLFVVKTVGSRKDGGDLGDDPSAVDLSGGGALKGKKKPATGGAGGGAAGGGGFVGGLSYEAALASNNQEITMGAKSGPDLTDGQISGPMRGGAFLGACGTPDSMKVTIRVAIKNGRAVGVTVITSPPNPGVAGCIDGAVRRLSWPSSSKMDTFTTQY